MKPYFRPMAWPEPRLALDANPAMKPHLHLITRADDAGSCRSANEAILEGVEAGITKNVSFMAVGPELEHAVELLGGRDDIAYGFHVCLNAEWETVKWGPLTESPVLVDEAGYFLPFPDDTKAAIERASNAEAEVVREFHAQLERLAEVLPLSYIDEHMGIGRAVPSVRREIENFCNLCGLIDAHPIPYLPQGEATNDPLAALEARLEKATGERYVWVTHPGKVAPDMNAFYLAGGQPGVVARERDAERQLLTDSRLPDLFARWKVEPTRYDEMPRG